MPRLTETRALRATLPDTGQDFTWDTEIAGFGCRLLPSGVRTWIVQLRFRGKSHRLALGRVGVLPFAGPEAAPGARDLALIAINAARRGEDPRVAIGRAASPKAIRLQDIWSSYAAANFPVLGDQTGRLKRASSVVVDRYRWGKHVSKLGALPVEQIDDRVVTRWLDKIEGLGARSQALTLLKTVLHFAASRGLATPQPISLKSRPSKRVQNFLKPTELKRLDAALVDLAAEQPSRVIAFAAIRLMLHTGCRKGEVLSLEREYVDLDHCVIHLPIHKGSDEGRDVLLSATAVEIIKALPIIGNGAGYLFFGRRRGRHLRAIEKPFREALKRAKLKRIRPHDLRHSFASTAIALGVSLYTTGKLLGHKDAKTTQRYSHLSAEAQRSAADAVAGALG